MKANNSVAAEFLRLVQIMEDLREKCPWDKKQTIHTLRQQTIEEMYELADAITAEDWSGIREELGDLLLHIVFYSKIGQEEQQFVLQEVIAHICDKLIRRHPHIYGDPANEGKLLEVKDEEEVKRNWEKLKIKEGKTSALQGIPKVLPAMVKAMRLQEKARQTGFDWENKDQVWEKVQEETRELETAINQGIQENIEDEFGDLLFSLVNYARFLRVDPENALERTNKKFIQRFTRMEEMAASVGKSLTSLTLSEMDELWNTVKKEPNR